MTDFSEKLKPFPILLTDEEAEHFVETANLCEYDFSTLVPMRFVLVPPKGTGEDQSSSE
ncbi:MAG: hypothetical protein JWL62_1692 [Hyphomicrobiales bacterium]|nr:hypothetical protein [Hyphomicrobiales bacterium]